MLTENIIPELIETESPTDRDDVVITRSPLLPLTNYMLLANGTIIVSTVTSYESLLTNIYND